MAENGGSWKHTGAIIATVATIGGGQGLLTSADLDKARNEIRAERQVLYDRIAQERLAIVTDMRVQFKEQTDRLQSDIDKVDRRNADAVRAALDELNRRLAETNHRLEGMEEQQRSQWQRGPR